jgi:divalent metal cation (Fe/Co/Zn/Cd) transporter
MSQDSSAHAAKSERTLRIALLLSMWAPLVTGIAVVMSQSNTQVADFIRRSVELMALFVSWLLFRHMQHHQLSAPERRRLERVASWFVAAALLVSGTVMLALVASLRVVEPGGNVSLGLTIGVLGVIVNGWFWRRYTNLDLQGPSAILGGQRVLYRSKTLIDVGVVLALGSVAFFPLHPLTPRFDVAGSLAVSLYLLWSGLRIARSALSDAG